MILDYVYINRECSSWIMKHKETFGRTLQLLFNAEWYEDLKTGVIQTGYKNLASMWGMKDKQLAIDALHDLRNEGVVREIQNLGRGGVKIILAPEKMVKIKEGGKEDEETEKTLYALRLH